MKKKNLTLPRVPKVIGYLDMIKLGLWTEKGRKYYLEDAPTISRGKDYENILIEEYLIPRFHSINRASSKNDSYDFTIGKNKIKVEVRTVGTATEKVYLNYTSATKSSRLSALHKSKFLDNGGYLIINQLPIDGKFPLVYFPAKWLIKHGFCKTKYAQNSFTKLCEAANLNPKNL